MANDLIELVDLARRWDISIPTLHRWRWHGTGPAYVKLGKKIFYRMKEVEKFENERLSTSTASYGRFMPRKTDIMQNNAARP